MFFLGEKVFGFSSVGSGYFQRKLTVVRKKERRGVLGASLEQSPVVPGTAALPLLGEAWDCGMLRSMKIHRADSVGT